MRLSQEVLDHYIAPRLSKLTACNMDPIGHEFPQSQRWTANFLLNNFFSQKSVEPEAFRYFLYFLRKCENTFAAHDNAQQALKEYTDNLPNNSIQLIMRAISQIEYTTGSAAQAAECLTKLSRMKGGPGALAFEKGDSSEWERLWETNNAIKHSDFGDTPATSAQIVWITNEGVESPRGKLSFADLRKCLRQLGQMADVFSRLQPNSEAS